MLGVVTLGNDSGISCFVETRLFKPDAEAFHARPAGRFCRKGRDGGRIDAAAEKDPQGHIGHESALHRFPQQLPKLLPPCCFRVGRYMLKRLQNEIPVLGHMAVHSIQLEQEIMAAGELEDLPIKGGRRRDITVGKVLLEAPHMNVGRDLRVANQGAQFRGE